MINYDPSFVQRRLLGKGIELEHSDQQQFLLASACQCGVCL